MRKLLCLLVAIAIPCASAMAFDAQNFYTPYGNEGFSLFRSDVLGHLQLWAGVSANYAKNPLQFELTASGKPSITKQVIDHYLATQFGLAVGFFDFLQLGIGGSYNRAEGHRIPAADAQEYGIDTNIPGLFTNDLDTSYWAGYIGDLRTQLKGQIFADRPRSVGVAIATELTYPMTPDKMDFYITFGSLTAAGWLVLQKTFKLSVLDLTINSNAGYRYVAPADYEDPETKETITIDYADSDLGGVVEWRAGVIVAPLASEQLNINGEWLGRHFDPDPATEFVDISNSIEALLGASYEFGFGLKLSAAVGTSIIKDVGGPDLRGLFQMAFTYPKKRRKALKPALDRDGDGISDKKELKLGLNPEDADTDHDGLDDGREIELGLDPKEADTDHDGLNDSGELSVGTDPKNPDTDQDGLPDGKELELRSDPKNPDTDGDGIGDLQDKAPTEPETVNGFQDEDGIPEREIIGFESGLVLYDRGIYQPQGILFAQNDSKRVLKGSVQMLKDILKLMKGYPSLQVRLIGHADPSEQKPEQLALERANMIKRFLVSQGISPDRIEVEGRGAESPATPSAEPSKLNRRVEIEMISM